MEHKLLMNRCMTPDGTVLISRHRHDFQEHLDADGNTYFTDGGRDYIRRTAGVTDCDIYTDSPFIMIHRYFEWGTRGIDGKSYLRYIQLWQMEEDHIKAVIALDYLAPEIREIMEKELQWRKDHPSADGSRVRANVRKESN
jgi:hypothetical protein